MANVIDRLGWVLDEVTHSLGSFFRQNVEAYCDLVTAELSSDSILVDHTGGLVSLIELSGVNSLSGAEETHHVIDRLVSSLGPMLKHHAYSLQVVFEYDPDPRTGKRLIDEHVFRLRRGAKRNGLENVEDILADTSSALGANCSFERVTLAVSTASRLLHPKRLKEERKEDAAEKVANLPMGNGTQNTHLSVGAIVDAHQAYVEQVLSELGISGMATRLLDAHEACYLIRQQIDPEATSHQWRAQLAGDSFYPTNTGRPDQAETDLMWSPLDRQLIPRDPEIDSLRTVTIGDRTYMPMLVEQCPVEPKPFARLFSSLRTSKTPYRISFRLQGDGLARNNMRNQVASSMIFAGSQNQRIRRAFKELEYFVKEKKGVVVGLAIDAVTWAHTDQSEQLRPRYNQLSSSLQAWGGAEVAEAIGAPMDGVTASVPGLRISSPSNNVCIPLEKALLMLPLMRPSSPWRTGNMLLRSTDGKLFPYRAYSKQQDAWISLIFAPMGRGKSVLLNALNLGLCLDESNSNLPMIRVLDIGFSSSGLISLLKEALPASRKHEALYQKLTMSAESAMNPMDTPLGCRRPLPGHMSYLVDLFALLATPLNADAPVDGITGIAQMVIDMAYTRYSDDKYAKPYGAGTEPAVDKALEKLGIGADADSTWWEIVDALSAAGETVTAHIAQSRAVPLLSECAALAKDPAVTNVYKGQSPTKEPMGDYFWRLITEAVNDYPILNAPTRLNFGAARVISLDLQEVAPRGGGKSARQTAIMYSVAMWVMSSEFFIGEDVISHIHPKYRDYHLARIERLKNSKKRLGADEFHRTEGQPQVRGMFTTIIREGRKFKVEVVLASQRHSDFDDTMIGLSSVRFVLGADVGAYEETAKRIGLGETAAQVMRNQLNGPTKGGSNLLASFNVKSSPGIYTHLLTNTQGARALWAFSTSSDDVQLRGRLYKRLGQEMAREVLSLHYPGGSVEKEVERRSAVLDTDNDYGDIAAVDHDPLKAIEEELVVDADRLREYRVKAHLNIVEHDHDEAVV